MEQIGFQWGVVVGGLPCAFGETGAEWSGPHHCHQCNAAVEEACRQFAEMVAAGVYDDQGYTPLERKAQAKRRQLEGVTTA